jgi:hypothetical protein
MVGPTTAIFRSLYYSVFLSKPPSMSKGLVSSWVFRNLCLQDLGRRGSTFIQHAEWCSKAGMQKAEAFLGERDTERVREREMEDGLEAHLFILTAPQWMVLKLWDPNSKNSPNHIPAHFNIVGDSDNLLPGLDPSRAAYNNEKWAQTKSEHHKQFLQTDGSTQTGHMAGKMNCKKSGIQKSRRIEGWPDQLLLVSKLVSPILNGS